MLRRRVRWGLLGGVLTGGLSILALAGFILASAIDPAGLSRAAAQDVTTTLTKTVTATIAATTLTVTAAPVTQTITTTTTKLLPITTTVTTTVTTTQTVTTTETCFPGNGNGDQNHVHCGPPGQQ